MSEDEAVAGAPVGAVDGAAHRGLIGGRVLEGLAGHAATLAQIGGFACGRKGARICSAPAAGPRHSWTEAGPEQRDGPLSPYGSFAQAPLSGRTRRCPSSVSSRSVSASAGSWPST